MDAKEYLSRAFVLNRKIQGKERLLKSYTDGVPYAGPLYGDVKVDTNMRHSTVEYSAIKNASLTEEIKKEKEELVKIMKSTSATIKRLNDINMETILEMRYLSFMDWDAIITRMGYSRCYVFKLHSIALKRIKRIVD